MTGSTLAAALRRYYPIASRALIAALLAVVTTSACGRSSAPTGGERGQAAVTAPAAAAAERCSVWVRLDREQIGTEEVSGLLSEIIPPAAGTGSGAGAMTRLVVEESGGQRREVLISLPSADLLPVAVGDSVRAVITCESHGPELLCDGRLDRDGQMVLGASGTGGTSLFSGWRVERADIVSERQSGYLQEKSLERNHALTFEHGSLRARVEPGKCQVASDGDETWLLSGHGVTWEGARPPEGVDYLMFSLVQRRR